MKEFVFNDDDICLNPNVIERYVDEKKLFCEPHFSIETACYNNKWTWGYDVMIHNQGGGCGAGRADFEKKYDTEKEAIKAACKHIRSYLLRNEYDSNGVTRLWDKKLMTLLNEIEHPQPVELDLFS